MSTLSDSLRDPSPRAELASDLLWLVLAILVFCGLLYAASPSVETLTSPVNLGAIVLGTGTGVAIAELAASDRGVAWFHSTARRLLALLAVIGVVQHGLRVAPIWTELFVIAAAVGMTPKQIGRFRRAR